MIFDVGFCSPDGASVASHIDGPVLLCGFSRGIWYVRSIHNLRYPLPGKVQQRNPAEVCDATEVEQSDIAGNKKNQTLESLPSLCCRRRATKKAAPKGDSFDNGYGY